MAWLSSLVFHLLYAWNGSKGLDWMCSCCVLCYFAIMIDSWWICFGYYTRVQLTHTENVVCSSWRLNDASVEKMKKMKRMGRKEKAHSRHMSVRFCSNVFRCFEKNTKTSHQESITIILTLTSKKMPSTVCILIHFHRTVIKHQLCMLLHAYYIITTGTSYIIHFHQIQWWSA
jgi:hypothetical protein